MCIIVHHKSFEGGVYYVERQVAMPNEVPYTGLSGGWDNDSPRREARTVNTQRREVQVDLLHNNVFDMGVQQEDISHIQSLVIYVDCDNKYVVENIPVTVEVLLPVEQ